LGASTFVSSLSLSGTSGCAEIGCRARRAATLARYAALYADLVIAPIQIADPHHTPRARSAREEDDFRYQTAGTVLCIRELGPVIDAGLARVIAPELYFCPGCKERAAARVRRVRVEARKLASRNRRSFSIACVRDAPTTVRIRGPQEYCEHPEFFRIFPKRPEWLPNLGDPDGTNLPPRVLRNSKIVDGVFSKIAGDVVLQEFLGSRYDAAITSNPGELALLSRLNPSDSVYSRAASALAHITHTLPLFAEANLEKAIRIRREEPDTFLVYRRALGELLQEVISSGSQISGRRIVEMSADLLQPELAKLRELANSVKRKAKSKARMRLALAGAVLSLGLFKGLLPSEFAALGGASILGLVDSLGELRTSNDTVRNENFYFLL